jgi:hypothetical protein
LPWPPSLLLSASTALSCARRRPREHHNRISVSNAPPPSPISQPAGRLQFGHLPLLSLVSCDASADAAPALSVFEW